MNIIDLRAADEALLEKLVQLTFEGAEQHNPYWLPGMNDAREELHQALSPRTLCRVVMDNELPVGWGAVIPLRYGVWELHPLIKGPASHRKGYGRYLVRELEKLAAAAGATTMTVSTSDATGATTLGGIDLYDDPLGRLANIAVTNAEVGHAYQFWLKAGYSIVGVLPDAH